MTSEQHSVQRQVRPASSDASPTGTRFTAATPGRGLVTDPGHLSPSPEVSEKAQARWKARQTNQAA